MIVDDLLLESQIGKGRYCEVFLTQKKYMNVKYATKKYDRNEIENIGYYKDLKNSIIIIQELNHPNIIQFKDIKKTSKSFYIIYDYYNGGNLSEILEKYQQKYGCPFSEKIVQHLMKKIVQAFIYIHNSGLIHRNIKLKNIFINFDTPQDKNNLNMMKATVKVGGFKYALKNSKNLLNKNIYYNNGFNKCPSQKKDIFDLGIICYKMILGKYAYDNYDDMEVLINEIEQGEVRYPISLSKEIISFLKCMLRNDSTKRLRIDELYNHVFLTKPIKDPNLINSMYNYSYELNQNNQIQQKKINYYSKKENTCLYCNLNPSDINYYPCGHKCVCKDCYQYLKVFECPMCKKK